MTRFVSCCALAAIAAVTLSGGCETTRQGHPAPPGHGFKDRDAEVVWLLHLHALKDLLDIAQIWAGMGADGGDQRYLTEALAKLDAARDNWREWACDKLAKTLEEAAASAYEGGKSMSKDPGEKQRLLNCLIALRDALAACNRDTICIGRALMDYLICVHDFKGPTVPRPSGSSSPAGRAR